MIARLTFFITCLIIFAVFEKKTQCYLRRLILHISLISIGSVLSLLVPIKFFFSTGLLGYLHLPEQFNTLISVIALDGFIYWQHRLFHKIPLLWRLHAVHHSDRIMDVTTGFRFHPIEIFISTLFKGLFIFLLGISPFAFLIFQIWLSIASLFTHAAINLPQTFRRYAEYIIVTPQLHWIHHLQQTAMQQKNFGFGLIIWDKLFNSFESHSPNAPEFGLTTYQEQDNLNQLLLLPLKI